MCLLCDRFILNDTTRISLVVVWDSFLRGFNVQVNCFELLQLVPVRFWARLIHMDRYNYGGLLMVQRGSEEEQQLRATPGIDRVRLFDD